MDFSVLYFLLLDLLIMDHSWWHIMGDMVVIINGIFIYALIYISAKRMSIKESQNPKFNFQIKNDIEAAKRRLLRRM
jgi:hypothetical protein